MEEKSTIWQGGDIFASTPEPSVSVTSLEEDIPSLTVATIIGVALVVLVAIAIVFVLGILIDCRQQRLLDEKMGEMKRSRAKRVPAPECDGVSIVTEMEEQATSVPPSAVLRNVP